MTTAAEIAKHLQKSKKAADGSWVACCPAHNDKNPSLSITDADGRDTPLLHCHAGCEFEDIIRHIPQWPSKEAEPQYEQQVAFKPDYFNPRRYIYKDSDDQPVYMVERTYNGTGKTFRQYTLNKGKLTPGIKNVERLPYRLPEIVNHDTVYIVEGEQCADAMWLYGYPTTCNSGGASNWDSNLNQYFKDKTIIIIPDNDEPGHKHAIKVAEELYGTARTITIANICSSLPEKADVVDYFRSNAHKLYKLAEIVSGIEQWQPGDEVEEVDAINWILPHKMQYVMDANWTVKDLIPATGLGAAYGKPGSGKTFWALDLAMHIASGKGYANKLTKHGPCAYIALESGRRFQNRVMKWAEENDTNMADVPFIVTPDQINLLNPDKDAERIIKGLRRQERRFGKPFKLVVIDTLSRAMAGGNENSPEDMTAFVASCDRIWKELECFVLIIHHVGKDAAQGLRGHSSLLGAVDTEIEVTSLDGADGEYKAFKTLKQRDGEDNIEFGFKLNTHTIGIDTDGEQLTTCVVEHVSHSDMPVTKRKSKGPTGANQKLVYKAIKQTVVDQGQDRVPGTGYPTLKTITEDQARRVADDLLTGDMKHKTTRFNEAVNGLIGNEFIMRKGEMIWLVE